MSFISDEKYPREICKAGQSEKECAYLGVTRNGFECWKESKIKRQIDTKVKDGLMSSKGDNCVGFDRVMAEKNKKKENAQ